MCTFDAPISRCETMRTVVVTDQTQAQCAREHDCPPGTACPLCGCFSGADWRDERVMPELAAAH
jgi:hypothetical protein